MGHRAAPGNQRCADLNHAKPAKQGRGRLLQKTPWWYIVYDLGFQLCGFVVILCIQSSRFKLWEVKNYNLERQKSSFHSSTRGKSSWQLFSYNPKITCFVICAESHMKTTKKTEQVLYMWIRKHQLNIKVSDHEQTAFFTFVTGKSLAKLLNCGKSWIW